MKTKTLLAPGCGLARLNAPPRGYEKAWFRPAFEEHIGVQEHRAICSFGLKLIQSDRVLNRNKSTFQPSVGVVREASANVVNHDG